MPDPEVAVARRQGSWDLLLHWCAERGSGRWPILRDACAHFDLPPRDTVSCLAALGHLELSAARGRWAAAPPVLVELESPPGRLLLTGAVTAELAGDLDAQLAEHEIEAAVVGPFSHAARGPSTIHVETEPSQWARIARHTGLPVASAFARRLTRLLPPAEAGVIGAPHTPDERLTTAPIDPESLQPAWGQPVRSGLPAVEVRPGRRLVWWARDAEGRARRLPAPEWAAYLTPREGLPPLVRYDAARRILRVDAAAPLPPLHARAAVLCSGRSGSRAHLAPGQAEDRFRGVPHAVADAICASLRQPPA